MNNVVQRTNYIVNRKTDILKTSFIRILHLCLGAYLLFVILNFECIS